MQVRAYLHALRDNGAVVNTAIAIGCAEGIVRNEYSNLLACNGGHIDLTTDWGKHLLNRMGFVKQNEATRSSVDDQGSGLLVQQARVSSEWFQGSSQLANLNFYLPNTSCSVAIERLLATIAIMTNCLEIKL